MPEESLRYKTKKGLYWKFFDMFANYGMQFIVGIFMARMLSPEDYGIIALPTIFLAIAQCFIDSGFSSALIRKPQLKNLTGILSNVTFPVLAKVQDDNKRMENIYRRMIRTSSFIIFPTMIGLSAVAHPLTLVAIGLKK